jgi:hypothetical protein
MPILTSNLNSVDVRGDASVAVIERKSKTNSGST